MSPEPPDQNQDGYAPAVGVVAAERAAVGAAIASAAGVEAVTETLDPEDCYDPAHQAILAAAAALAGAGSPVDPAAVLHQLTVAGQVGTAGGGPYLHTLYAEAATGPAAAHHARIAAADASRRRHHAAGCQITHLASGPDWSAEHPDQAAATLEAAAATEHATDALAPLGDTLPGWVDRQQHGQAAQVHTPWPDLDAFLRIRPGQLVIVGARPGNGKTLLAVNMAAHVTLRTGAPALVCSMEMDRDEITDRIVSLSSGVALSSITSDDPLAEREWDRIAGHHADLAEAPLYVDDTAVLTLPRLRSRLRWLSRRCQTPALVVIDYLGLMQAPDAERREQEVAALSRGLKLLAREFGVPIVACSQLNRGSETRADKRPTLADLRESGALEQDANAVLLLHRPSAYDPAERPGEVDLLVAKNRSGSTGQVTLAWQAYKALLGSMSPQPAAAACGRDGRSHLHPVN